MLSNLNSIVRTFLARLSVQREEGQAMIEYALIVSVISIAAVAVFTPLGTDILNAFTDAKNAF